VRAWNEPFKGLSFPEAVTTSRFGFLSIAAAPTFSSRDRSVFRSDGTDGGMVRTEFGHGLSRRVRFIGWIAQPLGAYRRRRFISVLGKYTFGSVHSCKTWLLATS
jgi:hypothetical protein